MQGKLEKEAKKETAGRFGGGRILEKKDRILRASPEVFGRVGNRCKRGTNCE